MSEVECVNCKYVMGFSEWWISLGRCEKCDSRTNVRLVFKKSTKKNMAPLSV